MEKEKAIAIIIVIIIFVAVIAGIIYFLGPQEPPQLTFESTSFSGKAGSSYVLDVPVSNNGGDARGVTVILESAAFGNVSSNSIDVPSHETKYAQCNIQVNDITNGEYPITVSYSYNGTTTKVTNIQPMFYVVPLVEIANVFWYRPIGYPLLFPEKSTIGSNDNTILYFHIKNDAQSTYSGLSATATPRSGTSGLTITPNFSSMGSIGPRGTSEEYSFALTSSNMPPGEYNVTIHVFSDNQYEAVNTTVVLKVAS